jgi:hypothetical protein
MNVNPPSQSPMSTVCGTIAIDLFRCFVWPSLLQHPPLTAVKDLSISSATSQLVSAYKEETAQHMLKPLSSK